MDEFSSGDAPSELQEPPLSTELAEDPTATPACHTGKQEPAPLADRRGGCTRPASATPKQYSDASYVADPIAKVALEFAIAFVG